MTSAPQSARIAPAAGTNVNWATSRTRTPCITLVSWEVNSAPYRMADSFLDSLPSASLRSGAGVVRGDAPQLTRRFEHRLCAGKERRTVELATHAAVVGP